MEHAIGRLLDVKDMGTDPCPESQSHDGVTHAEGATNHQPADPALEPTRLLPSRVPPF